MRQAQATKLELTDKLDDTNRKSVSAKDVLAALSQWEGELREYGSSIGNDVEESCEIGTLK